MGTIKCGFWKLDFILSPEEFNEFIEFCRMLNISPNQGDVCEQYLMFYNDLIATNQPAIFLKQDSISFVTLKGFTCGLSTSVGIGFTIGCANMVHWAYDNAAIRINGWALSISLQKGVSVNKEDEKGKYFVYEDIQLHSPRSYPLYQQITAYIKNKTKPLRFKTNIGNEIKPSVRVSKQVASDLADSWIFKNHNFEMISFSYR